MSIQNPLDVRRIVKASIDAVHNEQRSLDTKMESLLKHNGPGTANAFAPEVLREKQNALRNSAVESVIDNYNTANFAVVDLNKNAHQFTRDHIMRQAAMAPATAKKGEASTETAPVVALLRQLINSTEVNTLSQEVQRADGDRLLKIANRVARDGNLRAALVVQEEADNRTGITQMKVKQLIDAIEIPEADQHEENFEHLEGEQRDLRSAFKMLQTNEADTRFQMNRAMADQKTG